MIFLIVWLHSFFKIAKIYNNNLLFMSGNAYT